MSVDHQVMKTATLLAFLAVGAILYFAASAFIYSFAGERGNFCKFHSAPRFAHKTYSH
jgi:hypothetical protein